MRKLWIMILTPALVVLLALGLFIYILEGDLLSVEVLAGFMGVLAGSLIPAIFGSINNYQNNNTRIDLENIQDANKKALLELTQKHEKNMRMLEEKLAVAMEFNNLWQGMYQGTHKERENKLDELRYTLGKLDILFPDLYNLSAELDGYLVDYGNYLIGDTHSKIKRANRLEKISSVVDKIQKGITKQI